MLDRRNFLRGAAVAGGSLVFATPLQVLAMKTAAGAPPSASAGYGPLVPKGDLMLPAAFNYQVIDRQGIPMRDGRPTPGIFDGMGAFPDTGGGVHGQSGRTVLIRNHENRERAGEIKVVTGPGLEYDETAFGGNTKLLVERRRTGNTDPLSGQELYEYAVVDRFAILGGTSTNCAGGELPWQKWLTCEEVVKRTAGVKHGYNFEVDAMADGPVAAVPIPQMGRFVHEATVFQGGILYQTEDQILQPDVVNGLIGACLYRYVPDRRIGQSGNLAESTGVLEALAIKGSPKMNMDVVVTPGATFPVEWVPVPQPDHDDDSNNRRDRVPGFTPTRIQAIDRGAAYFDRMEGAWASSHGGGFKVYFDCTTGGPQDLGQVWEYDPGREVLTLVYISTRVEDLRNPDNITVVPQTQDIFLCEDRAVDGGPEQQFIRGVTQDGEIYNFAQTVTNNTEFAGACFDPDGQTLYVNQQGERGGLPDGPPDGQAVTYAIYGPFEKRAGANNKNVGVGAGAPN